MIPTTAVFNSKVVINQSIILTQGFHQENYQVINLDEPALHYDISVFPNPTQNQLNISFDIPKNTATIIVTDILGGIVYSKHDILKDELSNVMEQICAKNIKELKLQKVVLEDSFNLKKFN